MRNRRFIPIVVAILLMLVASALFLPRLQREMADFEVYWRVGGRVAAGEAIYRVEDGHFQHKYLPAFGLLVAPLSALPLTVAKVVWLYLVLGAIAGFLALSWAELKDSARRTERMVFAEPAGGAGRVAPATFPGPELPVAGTIALVVVLEAKFFAHEVTLGQSNAMMALAVVAAFAALRRQRSVWCGIWLALAIVLKPYPVIVVPYLAFTRRWTAAISAAAAIGGALLLPAVVYGMGANVTLLADWATTVTASTGPNLLNQDNVSVWAMWAKWLGPGPVASSLAAVTAIGLYGGLWSSAMRGESVPGREYLEMSLLLLLIPLCSPQGWDYGLLVSTPAVMLILTRHSRLGRPWQVASGVALVVMGFSLFDVMGRPAYASFMALSIISVCALALVATLVRLRVAGEA